MRSVLSSPALCARRSRSFSSAFSRMRANSDGRDAFSWVTGAGSRLRIASKITADVSPWNGSSPVAIW
jgi:hypothetical protein